jgi:hypothetical protein
MSNFQEIRAKSASLKAEVRRLTQQAAEQIKPLLQQFITEHPQVSAVQWRQYTPYFNDGETCVFNVHEPTFQFGGVEEGGDYDEGFHELWGDYNSDYNDDIREGCSQETYIACIQLARDLSNMEDELEVLFGDHVKVTVTAAGVEVEEYDHD